MTGHPASTIYAVLRRAGMARLRDADRLTGAPVRYVAFLWSTWSRAPGWQAGPRAARRRAPRAGPRGGPHHGHSSAGNEHLEVFVDDASRLAVVVPVPDERGASAARALEVAAAEFAAIGMRIERVLTDNGASLPQP